MSDPNTKDTHAMSHEILSANTEHESAAKQAAGWILGLLVSAGVTGARDLVARRKHQKELKEQARILKEEVREVIPNLEAIGPATGEGINDIKRTLVDLQREAKNQACLQEDRHTANLQRFAAIETTHDAMREDFHSTRNDIRQNREEIEGMRQENREQSRLMQKIWARVSGRTSSMPRPPDIQKDN